MSPRGAPQAGQRSHRPATSVALAVSAASLAVLPVFLTGALSVQLRSALHLGPSGLGALVAVFFGSGLLSTLVLGAVAERVGGLRMILAMAVVSTASLAAIAAVARSVLVLAVLLGVAGLANGGMQPAANLFVTERIGGARQGLAFGVKQAGIPVATLLSGLAVPALALSVGWQAGYGAAAALGVALLVVLALERRAAPGGVDRPRAGPESAPGPPQADGRVGAADPPVASRRQWPGRAGLEAAPLAVLAAAMTLSVSASNALGSFVVPSAVAAGLAPALAGAVSALGSFAGLATRVATGWRADRGDTSSYRDPLGRVAAMLGVGVLGYLALATRWATVLVPGVVVAYAAGWGWNGLFNLAVVRSHPHSPARATGLTQMGTYVGGACGPLLFGVLVDRGGYALAWGAAAVLALGGAAAMLVGRHLLTRRLHPEELAGARAVRARARDLASRRGS